MEVKSKGPRQTVCNEPTTDPKNPTCGGKLKRVTEIDAEARKAAGAGNDAYRCQICKAVYTYQNPYAVTAR